MIEFHKVMIMAREKYVNITEIISLNIWEELNLLSILLPLKKQDKFKQKYTDLASGEDIGILASANGEGCGFDFGMVVSLYIII